MNNSAIMNHTRQNQNMMIGGNMGGAACNTSIFSGVNGGSGLKMVGTRMDFSLNVIK